MTAYARRPPSRRTRRASRNAAAGSGINMNPRRQSTPSTLASSRSSLCASITRQSTVRTPCKGSVGHGTQARTRPGRWARTRRRPPGEGGSVHTSTVGLDVGRARRPQHRNPRAGLGVRRGMLAVGSPVSLRLLGNDPKCPPPPGRALGGDNVYIGVGTLVVILLVVVIVMLMRRGGGV